MKTVAEIAEAARTLSPEELRSLLNLVDELIEENQAKNEVNAPPTLQDR